MKKPTSLKRIAIELIALLVLHALLLPAMDYFRVVEKLLSPGSEQVLMLIFAMLFLMIRFFTLVIAPGWFICRLLPLILVFKTRILNSY